MKLVLGLPEKKTRVEEENPEWKTLESTTSKNIYFLGIVGGIVLTLLLSEFIRFFTLCNTLNFAFYKKIYLILLLIPIHEGIHLLFLPNMKSATVGFSTKLFAAYISSEEIFTKNRYLIVLIAPFFFLTILPVILLFFYENYHLAYFALYNTIGAGVDLIMFFSILGKPYNILLKYNGSHLYYKKTAFTA